MRKTEFKVQRKGDRVRAREIFGIELRFLGDGRERDKGEERGERFSRERGALTADTQVGFKPGIRFRNVLWTVVVF